jgi:N,N-dimethylformamidase
MGNFIAWAFALAGILAGVAALEWYQLYVRCRWRTKVQLPDPVAYTDAPDFRCDQEIALRIHSTKPVRVRFNRSSASEATVVHEMEAEASLQSHTMHRWRGFDWRTSLSLAPNTLSPGFYRVDIDHRDDVSRQWCMPLIVSDPSPQSVVVVASTNTWNAYNDFGGLSNYVDRATPQPLRAIRTFLKYFHVRIRLGDRHWFLAVPLPEKRPNAPANLDMRDSSARPSHLAREESALIRFLEREGTDYTVISDRSFAYEIDGSGPRLVIFNTHSEYWSDEMMGRLGEFIQRGTSVLFLSGNNMYRKVQFTQNGISVTDLMTPPEQVVSLIGTYYDAYGYLTYEGYRVMDARHWCFEGLPIHEGSEFGHATSKHPAASGYETDKIRPGADGFRVIAVGKNREGPAFMACRDLPGGGFVFTVGSVSFTPCLDDDPVIQQLVRNLIRRVLAAKTTKDLRTEQLEVTPYGAIEST